MVDIKTDYSGIPTSRITTKYKPPRSDTKSTEPMDTISLSKGSQALSKRSQPLSQGSQTLSQDAENVLLRQMLIEKEKDALNEREMRLNEKEKFLASELNNKEKTITNNLHERENALAEKTTLNERYLEEKKDALRKEKETLEKEKKENSEQGGLSHILTGVKKIFFPNS